MDQFNKVLSFVLGLVVVAVFIIVASGKFNLKSFNFLKPKVTINVTPTPTPNVDLKPTSKPWFSFSNPFAKPTATPTPKAPMPKPTAIPLFVAPRPTDYNRAEDPNFRPYSGSPAATSIPNTGIPVILFPLLGTSLLTGIFMKKTGKK